MVKDTKTLYFMAKINYKMKNILCTFFFAFTLTQSFGQTNVYFPFPDSNAVWNISNWGADLMICERFSYTITGDTIINSNTYHKLTKKYMFVWWNYGCNWNNPLIPVTSYAGAIRQDTSQRKVYFIEPSSSTDTLLYNFNLNVGDTVKTYISSFCSPGVVVTSMDSILIGTLYRKRWIVQGGCLLNGKIIEGIGSESGLLETMIDFEWGWNLDCFSQNNQTLFPDYSTNSECPLITSISNQQNLFRTVSILPNPSNGLFDIQSSNTISEIEIMNFLGQSVYLTKMNSESTNINLRNQPTGIYFIFVTFNDKTIMTDKLLIMD